MDLVLRKKWNLECNTKEVPCEETRDTEAEREDEHEKTGWSYTAVTKKRVGLPETEEASK